jgi:hypothetical protein
MRSKASGLFREFSYLSVRFSGPEEPKFAFAMYSTLFCEHKASGLFDIIGSKSFPIYPFVRLTGRA